ncbi:MAG: spore germination protein [Thermoanaerobacteraceae bacterium]|jgi:spore germination protein KC|nr:spore germination protein [Thermoanaerobacteraceae bacterium]
MRRKVKLFRIAAMLAVLCLVLLILSGCWNNRDLSELNMVTALGIERSEDGKVLVTVQVVEPAAIQSTASGKGKGGGEQPKPVFTVSYKGETVFDALRSMLSQVDKRLFLSTTQVLILGERLSKDGIVGVLDFFQRDHEVEYEMDVLVAKDTTPTELLQIENDIDPIPAVYIKKTVENTVSRAKVKRTMLIDLIKDIGNSGRQPVIGQITKAGEKVVRTEGAAAFKDGKLVGWLGPYATRGFLFATDKVKSAIVNIPADDGKISMEIIRSKGKVDIKFENGKPALLTVQISLEANVGEYEGEGKLASPDALHKLEEILGEEIKKEIGMAIKLAQKEYSSDIFGFGEQIHKYHPQYWKKVENNWDDVFSNLPVEIKVDAEVRRTGVIKDPIKKD